MNLKRIMSLLFIAGILFACDTPKDKENKEVKETKMEKTEKTALGATRFEELKGYFVKNDVKFDKDLQFAALSDQAGFDKYFGIAKTMDNKVTPLDFEKYNVAAILIKPSKTVQEIKMTRYTSEGAKQIIEFKIVPGKEQSFTSSGLLLFKIPKSRTSVDFVNNGQTTSVQVK